jgi:hypothetical protein
VTYNRIWIFNKTIKRCETGDCEINQIKRIAIGALKNNIYDQHSALFWLDDGGQNVQF